MPRAAREAEVVWEGSSARGAGAITAATSGAFAGLPFTEPTRIGDPEGKTSPEELVAAAHAACYAMSLAAELTKLRTPPERLEVRATVTIDEVEGAGHRIVSSDIAATVRSPRLDAEMLARAAQLAHEGCLLSNLVKASATVTIDARLEEA